jgi:hypothetical protein
MDTVKRVDATLRKPLDCGTDGAVRRAVETTGPTSSSGVAA